MKTGGKIRNFDGRTVPVRQARQQDGRVGQIGLAGLHLIDQLHRAIAGSFAVGMFAQQGAENRVSVEPGQTAPDDFTALID